MIKIRHHKIFKQKNIMTRIFKPLRPSSCHLKSGGTEPTPRSSEQQLRHHVTLHTYFQSTVPEDLEIEQPGLQEQ